MGAFLCLRLPRLQPQLQVYWRPSRIEDSRVVGRINKSEKIAVTKGSAWHAEILGWLWKIIWCSRPAVASRRRLALFITSGIIIKKIKRIQKLGPLSGINQPSNSSGIASLDTLAYASDSKNVRQICVHTSTSKCRRHFQSLCFASSWHRLPEASVQAGGTLIGGLVIGHPQTAPISQAAASASPKSQKKKEKDCCNLSKTTFDDVSTMHRPCWTHRVYWPPLLYFETTYVACTISNVRCNCKPHHCGHASKLWRSR